MTSNDFQMFVYHFRETPEPQHIPSAFVHIETERLAWNKETALMIAGVVTGFCDRYPIEAQNWQLSHPKLLRQARAVAAHRTSRISDKWSEYLGSRWLVLATDECAWELLYLCHYAASDSQRKAAQDACNNLLTFSIDGKSMHDSKGNLVGKVYFEDMRLQITRLARDFAKLTISERQRPFSKLVTDRKVSAETQQAVLAQRAGFAVGLGGQSLSVQ